MHCLSFLQNNLEEILRERTIITISLQFLFERGALNRFVSLSGFVQRDMIMTTIYLWLNKGKKEKHSQTTRDQRPGPIVFFSSVYGTNSFRSI